MWEGKGKVNPKGLLPPRASQLCHLGTRLRALGVVSCPPSRRLAAAVSAPGMRRSPRATRGRGEGELRGLGSDPRKGPPLCSGGVSRLTA